MKKKKGTGVMLWGILTPVFAILLVAAIIGTNFALGAAQAINIKLKTPTFKIQNGDPSAVYFETGFSSAEKLEAHDREVAEQLSGEGITLLMNNGALPLASGSAISTFSRASVAVATCGTGSADIDTSNAPSLKEALESRGFQVNPTLWNFYATGAAKDYMSNPSKATGAEGLRGGNAAYHVNEVPVSVYTDDVKSSFADYGDVALVTISRISGEMFDMPAGEHVDGVNSLSLTQEEKDMLSMVRDAGFDKTVVLINSTNAMQCDFITSGEYGIDAALWIGYTGTWGLNALSNILAGDVNPSGHLVDTYCIDNTGAPAMVGFYGSNYSNAPQDNSDPNWYYYQLDGNMHYNTYQEGIYVGYRYYETRYEDVVMGQGNAGGFDYAGEVAYPFGYGLSYTTFEWSGFECAYDGGSDSFNVKTTVKNTGDTTGKEVVQVYFQSPYTDYDRQNGIEKAAVELCGFAKTKLLEPGQSETVTINVPREELACYDRNGAGTYILDAGEYYLTAAHHAHEAVNNILTAKGYSTADGMDANGNVSFTFQYAVDSLDAQTYSVSSATGNPITNQFENTELSYYGIDGMTYLSRSDWQGTWPQELKIEANDALIADLNQCGNYKTDTGSSASMPTMGADNGLTLGMMIGKAYDDPDWEKLLDQATFEEMAVLIGQGYHNTAMMISVSKPATLDDNGPQGFTQALTGITTCHCAYSDENIMAATYNVELMEEVGRCIGSDVLDLGAAGLYGPAMNIHRTAYAGRNFEYYSEDGFLSGAIAAAECRGIQEKGVYVYIKHFALNDSETLCRCVSTWCSEQAIRELYLKPFQMAVVDGGAYNVMNSFARFGAVWSGAHKGLMTEVLRKEWGMRGFGLTDFSGNPAFSAMGMTLKSFDAAYGVLAGTNSWDSSSTQWSDQLIKNYRSDPDIAQAMRESTHRILYTVANSCAMNGFSAETEIVSVTPWWQIALYALDVVMGVLFAGSAAMLVRAILRKKKQAGNAV